MYIYIQTEKIKNILLGFLKDEIIFCLVISIQ